MQRYVLFDPFDHDDMYNASLISAAVNVEQFRLPYTSHYSFRLLASSDAFKQFVQLAREGQTAEIRAFLRARRKQNGTYRLYLGRKCSVRRHWRAALSLMTSSEQLGANTEELLVSLAEHHDRQGDLDKAIEVAKRATESAPTQAYCYWMVGSLQMKKGELVEAEIMLRRAIELDPGVAHFHFDLWSALKLREQSAAAIAAGRASEALFVTNAHFMRYLAILFRDNGQLEEAEVRFRRAITIDDGHLDFHLELADVLQRQGRVDLAIEAVQISIARFPSNEGLKNRLAGLLKTADTLAFDATTAG
jgi:tetratricopeptide (TPR) repeat protein